jgi:hypothetical protein
MTEQPVLPAPSEPPEPVVVAQKRLPRNVAPWLCGLGFLILAIAIIGLWQYPSTPDAGTDSASAIRAVEQRLADTDARLTRLEQRPIPDLGKITARLDAIDGRITDQTRPIPDLGKITARLDAIDGRITDQTRPTPDLGKITARLDALDGRIVDQTRLASRVDTLSGRIESLSGRDQAGLDATGQKLDALTSRIAAVESNAGSLDAVTKRLNRIARLQEASFALAAGRPVGDLPGAPEALARYARVTPPTEAQLRLRFPRDEQAALAAKQPDPGDAPFVDRVWERAQGLITIRRGEDVVVGNPSAITLIQAQTALDAGDLAGAISAVEALRGQPAQAMAHWLTDAKALLGARSALADMAGQA